jgi:peptidoglycan/LPS O-acetylase OafA/YrhL
MNLFKIVKSASLHGSSELERVDYLDGWRGVAILLVLLSHFFNVVEVDLGRMGVDVFFVLSGMLMSNILFIKRTPLSIFYKRRISRVLPVFIVFLSLISLVSLVFNISSEHFNYFYNLFFIRAYYPVEPGIFNSGLPLGHLWSLNVEEHVYVLLSLITLVSFYRNRICLILLALGGGAIFLQVLYVKFPQLTSEDYSFRTEVAASFLLISAGYFLVKERVEKFVPSWLPVVTFFIALICYSTFPLHWSAQWLIAPILLAFTVNHLNSLSPLFKRLLCLPVLRLIGIWSFSIYLWQQPLYYWGTKGGDAFYLAGPVLFILSIILGAMSFYLIENPVRRYLNNNW